MIKVNLLKNRVVVGGASVPSPLGAANSGTGVAEDIGKAGFSNLSLSPKDRSSLDKGFDTFECSPIAQFIKLILLVGFIVPLVAYEKMRANSGKTVISAKSREIQSYQALKFDKQKIVNSFNGLEDKKEEVLIRDKELFEIKTNRLTALFGIDELQTLVPDDVWLTSINFIDGGRLDISGQTLLDSGLDRLHKALKASRRLTRINVQQDINIKSRKGRTVNEFKITMFVLPVLEDNSIEDL